MARTGAGWYETQKSQQGLQRKDNSVSPTRATGNLPSTNTAIDPFRGSGLYTGVTVESDGAVQEVETFLQFLNNGKVEGIGFDEEDGPYRVRGTWRGSTVNWTEKYEDYSVRVECTCPGLALECTFVSSVDNIKGAFELRKKYE